MTTREILRRRSGSTIVLTLILLFAVTALTIAGLSAATSNLKVSRNYRTATQALLAAEAGSLHAHERISDWGVIRFERDVVDRWNEVFGTGWRELPGHPDVRYSATVSPDPENPNEFVLLTTVGQAPGESTRTIVTRLQADQFFSPGSIYLPGSTVDARFDGNSFLVDGFDTNLDGSHHVDPHGEMTDVPGITTRTEEAKNEVEDEISTGQTDNVIGDGGSPSVELSIGPTVDRIQTEFIPNILSQPGVVTDPSIKGNDTFGTIANPQITHFTGDLFITMNGTMDGVGILIVDGALRINGDLNFVGLILVRGTTEITTVSGNATILGALWTTNLDLAVAGTASVTYSTEALALAGDLGVDLLPQRTDAVAWKEL